MDKILKEFIQASRKGDVEKIEIFLKNGIDPNIKDEFEFSPLVWACRKGHINVVKLLIDSGGKY